ncbi:MAG: response regulator transcription factor [Acholeplasmataceae bacterium]|nr:response regulator transcription factor [Acholeplasmataceae bacterium]
MAMIYYVEDDQAIGFVIEKTINHANLFGRGFQLGQAFLKAYKENKPDMILLDVMLPDMSGLDILKTIRKEDKMTPIMMISALQNEMDKVIALDLGADDYMTKPFGILELTSRIQAKLRNISDEKIYQMGNVSLNDKKHLCLISDREIYLTNKEYAILKLLLKNKGEVVSKETIFNVVWETDFIGETRTLDMHIKSLRNKFKENYAIIEIVTVRGIGYHIV